MKTHCCAMPAGLIAPALFALLVGCTSTAIYNPETLSDRNVVLDDCTSATMDWDVPQVSMQQRDLLIKAASAWAEDNCYAPCEFRMCATIRRVEEGMGTVYVSFDWAEWDEFVIGPEAQVTFDMDTFAVREQEFWHTGCRFNATDCNLELD